MSLIQNTGSEILTYYKFDIIFESEKCRSVKYQKKHISVENRTK